MRNILQWTLWSVGLGLQFLVVSTLMMGPMRDYTAVFIYSVVLFFTTIVEMLPIMDQGRMTEISANIYWICEFVRQASMVFLVVSLVARAVADEQRRRIVRQCLLTVAICFWGISFYIHHNPNVELWMTSALRNVSFAAALVNLTLWFTLITSKQRDTTLLMITGGLGLQMTGEAIGQSLRQLSRETVIAGNAVAILSHFFCLYIWWQAFRAKVVRGPDVAEPTAVPPSASDAQRRSAQLRRATPVVQ